MIRIGKCKYLVDLQEGSDLDLVSAYFIIEFEYDSKLYVGWTGNSLYVPVRVRLEQLIYYALKGSSWMKKNNPELIKAIEESKYITVTTIKMPFTESPLVGYTGLYALIDKYTTYSPYGHNIINALNKSEAEKQVIHKYALKWGIPEKIHRPKPKNSTIVKSYPARAVYQYKRISDGLYKLYKKWDSIKEYINSMAPMKINPSAIYMCCNGQRRIAYEDIWRFDCNEEIIKIAPDARKVRITNNAAEKVEAEIDNRVNKLKAAFAKINELS